MTTTTLIKSPPAQIRAVAPARASAGRVWRETLYLLLDLPVGVAGFTFVVTALSVGLSLAITLVGIPLLAGTLVLARWAGRAELARARLLLDHQAPAPDPLPRHDTVLARVFAPIRDSAAWQAMAYFALMLPAGIATFTAAVTWWATGLFLLTLPTWAWTLPHNGPEIPDNGYWNDPWQLAVSTVAGLLMVLGAGRVIHGLTALDRGMLRLLHRPGGAAR